MATNTRAAAYYRMSTDRQEDSPERQRSQVVAYITQKQYRQVGEYLDAGIAGDEFDRRPEFQRLLQDSKAGKFDVIVIDELSRLSRQEVIDFIAKVVHPLKEAGVRVDSVAEGPLGWDTVVEIITLTIRQDKSASESPRLARRVMTGLLRLTKQDGYTGGPPPYGYVLVADPVRGKKLLPDPVRGEHVRMIFRLVDEGHTLGGVREALYQRGIPSPSAHALWSRNGLRRLLTNPRYCGDYVWGRQASGKHVRQAKGADRKRRPGESRFTENAQVDWVIRPDSHEPLIDRGQFERVKARLQSNRKRTTPHVNGGDFLLNKLLVCGQCGCNYVGTRKQQGPIYVCGGWVSYGKAYCCANTIRQDKLVRVLMRKLKEEFLNPQALELLREEVRRQEQQQRDPARIVSLETQERKLTAKITKGNENLAILPPDRIPGVVEAIRGWEGEREQLLRELQQLQIAPIAAAGLEEHIKAVEATLWRLDEVAGSADPSLLRHLLGEMVSKVELHFDHRQTEHHTRCTLRKGIIYMRTGEPFVQRLAGGTVSSKAKTAQPVDAKLRNCDLPPGSPLSKNVCTGRLRVSTIQEPSSFWVESK
ncbi:MAG: recombinase family protein [Gemmataceae bacterium]|nr:recombinase family protein [Gemmataceae bacterium]